MPPRFLRFRRFDAAEMPIRRAISAMPPLDDTPPPYAAVTSLIIDAPLRHQLSIGSAFAASQMPPAADCQPPFRADTPLAAFHGAIDFRCHVYCCQQLISA